VTTSRLRLPLLLLVLAAAGLTVAAGLMLFSTFMFYDDEGYVLISLINFAKHGGLYRDVYTQYGPFPFVFYYGLQSAGIPITHTLGRLVTLGAWAGTAWSCAMLVGHTTRNLLVRLAVLVAVFVYLWVMANEPTHPGGLIVILTALLAVLGYRWIARGQHLSWAVLAGGGTAILLLTKINIGIFVAFSACSWLLLHYRNDRLRHWAPVIVGLGCVVLPFALMRSLLGAAWVQDFIWVFACSGVAVVMAIAATATGCVNWRNLVAALAVAGGVAIAVLGVVLLRGAQPHDLLDGMLLAPLRQPLVFSLGYEWPPGIRVIAFASAAACAAAWTLRRRGLAGVDMAVAGLRLLATLALAIDIACYPMVRPDYLAFGWCLPCLWFFVWPLTGEDPAHIRARAWLALLLLGQSLHVFPVPGSQIAWGTVLIIPLAVTGAWEAAAWLARRRPDGWAASHRSAFAVTLGVAGLTAVSTWNFVKVAGRYRDSQSIGLPGVEMVRLPENAAALFRVLAYNAAAHADLLFSLPGTFSFNIWTDLPTPTLANVTHWFSLLDTGRQQAIIRELEAHPRACVIVYPGHIKFLADRNLAPRGPLVDYIMKNFDTAFAFDDVEFRVHRGRKIMPFLVAELLTLSPEANDRSEAESSLLKFALLPMPGRAIARIEISSVVPGKPAVLNAENARLEITPANSRGEPVGPAQRVAWPATITSPSILSVYYDGAKLPMIRRGTTIVVRGVDGAEVALARLGF